ncbi:MAG: TIGR02186 family protein [Pseudomonadota bacterium]
MIRLALLVAFVSALVVGETRPAKAESLIVTLSRPTIAVRSNFTGTQIVVFGGIERDGMTIARRGYDIVAIVRGPAIDTTIRRKDRVMGLWINRGAERYDDLPGYYAVLSNRPLDEIASERLRRSLTIGAQTLVEPEHLPDSEPRPPTPYGEALLETRRDDGLYVEIDGGVSFLGRAMFRGTAILPASVPIGRYTVDVHLLSGGALLTSETQEFLLHKEGFEQVVTSVAENQPVFYGLGTIALAFFTGWLGSVIFRRD